MNNSSLSSVICCEAALTHLRREGGREGEGEREREREGGIMENLTTCELSISLEPQLSTRKLIVQDSGGAGGSCNM